MTFRNQIATLDALGYLRTLPDGSVNCIVTSPPYFGLRDYGVEGQIGLEPTPAEYVANLVAVFREAKRVLRADGTCWVNLGDSYGSGEVGRHDSVQGREIDGRRVTGKQSERQQRRTDTGVRPKSLIGIPWRFALAMMDDGWILRNDAIWHKPNPMPSSAGDRFTVSHEYVFFFVQQPRYWSDLYAVREPLSKEYLPGGNHGGLARRKQMKHSLIGNQAIGKDLDLSLGDGHRNARDVWTIPPEPFPGAHFAVMPSKLVERCILAGCPETVCAVCGAPHVRVVEHAPSESVGFQPTCTCGQTTAPGLVLDPFMGSGTVARTAIKLRRDFCGCDLNPHYTRMAAERLENLQVHLFL